MIANLIAILLTAGSAREWWAKSRNAFAKLGRSGRRI